MPPKKMPPWITSPDQARNAQRLLMSHGLEVEADITDELSVDARRHLHDLLVNHARCVNVLEAQLAHNEYLQRRWDETRAQLEAIRLLLADSHAERDEALLLNDRLREIIAAMAGNAQDGTAPSENDDAEVRSSVGGS